MYIYIAPGFVLTWCQSLALSTLFVETGSLAEPGAHWLGETGWSQSTRNLPVHIPFPTTVFQLQVCVLPSTWMLEAQTPLVVEVLYLLSHLLIPCFLVLRVIFFTVLFVSGLKISNKYSFLKISFYTLILLYNDFEIKLIYFKYINNIFNLLNLIYIIVIVFITSDTLGTRFIWLPLKFALDHCPSVFLDR